MFPVLGVSPLMGRGFTQREDDSSVPVTVLSYQMWHTRFHGERNILGQKILLDRKPYEIVGVMPRDFEFPLVPGRLNRTELWIPMSLTPDELRGQGGWIDRVAQPAAPGANGGGVARRRPFHRSITSAHPA
jgi:putative ABC transport system permease protein